MGTIYNRGSKHAPRWWIGYVERDGSRKLVPSKQPTKEQARQLLQTIEANIAAGRAGLVQRADDPGMGSLIDDWSKALHNRNAADDRRRIENHLRPAFGSMALSAVTLAAVMKWIDAMRDGSAPRRKVEPRPAKAEIADYPGKPGPKRQARPERKSAAKVAKLSAGSMRHNVNLLSRFFSWAIERGHTTANPVRMIPTGKRPAQAAKHDVPWLDDDKSVRDLFHALPSPVSLMFYIANRSGLRTGEVAGLRMSDLGFLDEGTIRVRFSYDGALKEDKHGTGKVKWVPASDDLEELLAPHLARRRDERAGPEDYAFPCATRDGSFYRKEFIEACWERASKACGIEGLTWYQATRHAFVSRNMSRGASLDEISAAVGHSSPVVTRRYYDHFVRRTFSASLRGGLGLKVEGEGASVVPIRRAK